MSFNHEQDGHKIVYQLAEKTKESESDDGYESINLKDEHQFMLSVDKDSERSCIMFVARQAQENHTLLQKTI